MSAPKTVMKQDTGMTAMAMSEFRHIANYFIFFTGTVHPAPLLIAVRANSRRLSLGSKPLVIAVNFCTHIGCPGSQEAKFNVQRMMYRQIWL